MDEAALDLVLARLAELEQKLADLRAGVIEIEGFIQHDRVEQDADHREAWGTLTAPDGRIYEMWQHDELHGPHVMRGRYIRFRLTPID